MALLGLRRRSVRAAMTAWAAFALLWCVTLAAPTMPDGLPNGLLLPTVLAIVAAAAVCLVLRHCVHLSFTTTGPPRPIGERYQSSQIVWAGDPDIPGKPQARAPGAESSLR